MATPRPEKEQIHREYVTSDISIRALASKYGVGKSTIANWMQQGAWTAEKKAYLQKAAQRAQERANAEWERGMEQYVDALAQRTKNIYESADLLLLKVNELLQLEDALAPRDLKSLSSTLLDLKMIHDIKPAETEDKSKGQYTVEFIHMDWGEEENAKA